MDNPPAPPLRSAFAGIALVALFLTLSSSALLGQDTAPEEATSEAAPAEPTQAQPETPASATPQSVPEPPAELTVETATAHLETIRSQIAALPEDAAEGTPETQRRAELTRRKELLEEYLSLEQRAVQIQSTNGELEQRATQAAEGLAAIQQEPEPTAPDEPTQAVYEELQKKLAEQREQLSTLQGKASANNQRMQQLPERVAAARSRAEQAEQRAQQLVQDVGAATAPEQRAILEIRLGNARLEQSVARRSAEVSEAESKLAQAVEPVLTDEIRLAETRVNRLARRFELYSQSLETMLQAEQRAQQREAERKQKQAEVAEDPVDRFVAGLEAELAQSRANQGELETAKIRFQTDSDEQETRLAAEKLELESLRDYLERSGGSAQAANRIQLMLRRLDLRHDMLTRRTGLTDQLDEYRSRRFAIEDTLFGLSDRWAQRLDELTEGMSEAEGERLRQRVTELETQYREALRKEKGLLTDVISAGQTLQSLRRRRLAALDEMQRFVRGRAFWLRDHEALGLSALRGLPAEATTIGQRVGSLGSAEVRTEARGLIRKPVNIALGVVLFPVLPALLLYLRQRMRRAVNERQQRTLDYGNSPGNRWSALITALIAAVLLPAYLAISAAIIARADLPQSIGPLIALPLRHLSWLLLAWMTAKALFAPAAWPPSSSTSTARRPRLSTAPPGSC